MKSSPSSKTTSGVKAAYAPLTLKDKVLRVLGPGLITGASDDDPSGIATYSQAGAQFGFSITWTLLFTYPFMAAIQEISGRIGRITGQGIAANLRQHYPNWLLQSIVALVLIANTINIVRPSFEQFAGRMVPPRLLVLNSHSRVGNNTDRFLFVWLYRWFPCVLGAIAIVRPETIIRWHRAGFRAYWRWRSRNRIGRPKVSAELRTLIGEMSGANPLWGAPRIHGELLKLGFEVAQSTVARYVCRGRLPPSQGWRTFLHNHADGIAAVDLFVLPTVAFQTLYCLVVLRHGRRHWMSFGVTSNPTAEWISRQITEAFP
jgi:hypothetical protein